jgi:hypothetical protein
LALALVGEAHQVMAFLLQMLVDLGDQQVLGISLPPMVVVGANQAAVRDLVDLQVMLRIMLEH